MHFRLHALDDAPFRPYYGRSESELAALGADLVIADAHPGFPCRVSLRDAEAGARMILLNHEYLCADSPYRGRHAIFVSDGATTARPELDEVPDSIGRRLLSVRAFNARDRMVEADVCAGADAAACFRRLLALTGVVFLQAHTARQGCYLARVVPQ